jgi:hypothetical protein
MHYIKIDRARKLADVGRYNRSCEAMLAHVPPALIDRLTSAELAMVLDALWSCAQKSKGIAERDIVAEGAVWDATSQRLIELHK